MSQDTSKTLKEKAKAAAAKPAAMGEDIDLSKFVSEADQTHMLALLLLPFVRRIAPAGSRPRRITASSAS